MFFLNKYPVKNVVCEMIIKRSIYFMSLCVNVYNNLQNNLLFNVNLMMIV